MSTDPQIIKAPAPGEGLADEPSDAAAGLGLFTVTHFDKGPHARGGRLALERAALVVPVAVLGVRQRLLRRSLGARTTGGVPART
jgi:hypothetical protein